MSAKKDPLYGKFQDWKTGKTSHLEMDEAIHETHKSWQKVYSLFTLNLSDNLAGVSSQVRLATALDEKRISRDFVPGKTVEGCAVLWR